MKKSNEKIKITWKKSKLEGFMWPVHNAKMNDKKVAWIGEGCFGIVLKIFGTEDKEILTEYFGNDVSINIIKSIAKRKILK